MKDDDSYDVVLGPEIRKGEHIGVRQRGDATEIISFRSMRDGEPLAPGAEIVDLEPSAQGRGIHKAKTLYRAPLAGGDGPAQVATSSYRDGYDRIFGKKPSVGSA